VVMPSHPENESGGELRDYTAAVFQYAFDGAAPPSSKGFLANGEKRIMNKSTADNDPLYTKIGDRQYHHFMVDLTAGATNFVITLDGNDSFNLNLYVARDTFAFASLAGYADTSAGSDKTISIDSAAPGVWYIGVECATTVETEIVTWGYEYTGQLEVLNGVEYTIQADWNITDIAMNPHSKMGVSGLLVVQVEGNTATIRAGNLPPYSMKIFDLQGSLCWEPQTSPTTVIYRWQPESPGMYFVWMKSGKDILTKRFTVVK